jgi:hypothetical protein
MQFGGSGATRGKSSGFCVTIPRRSTHRLCSSSSVAITQPPHSPDLAPSEFWLKMGLKGARGPNSGIYQKESLPMFSHSGRIDGAIVRMRKGPTLKVIR